MANEPSVARRGTTATTTRSMQLSAFDGDKRGKRALTPEEQRREAEQMEELSVFRAVGGLVAAAAGGGLVFVLGAGRWRRRRAVWRARWVSGRTRA